MLPRNKPTGEGQPEKKKTKRQELQDKATQAMTGKMELPVGIGKTGILNDVIMKIPASLLPDDVGPVPLMNAAMTECKIFTFTLRVQQTIDYLGTAEHRTGVGRIEKFKHPGLNGENKETVWFYIKDAEKDQTFDWVSVRVWAEQKRLGLFDMAKEPVKELPPQTDKPAF